MGLTSIFLSFFSIFYSATRPGSATRRRRHPASPSPEILASPSPWSDPPLRMTDGRLGPSTMTRRDGLGAASSQHLRRRAPSPADRVNLGIQETPLNVRGTHTTGRSSSRWRPTSLGPRRRVDPGSVRTRLVPDASLAPHQLFEAHSPGPRLPSPLRHEEPHLGSVFTGAGRKAQTRASSSQRSFHRIASRRHQWKSPFHMLLWMK